MVRSTGRREASEKQVQVLGIKSDADYSQSIGAASTPELTNRLISAVKGETVFIRWINHGWGQASPADNERCYAFWAINSIRDEMTAPSLTEMDIYSMLTNWRMYDLTTSGSFLQTDEYLNFDPDEFALTEDQQLQLWHANSSGGGTIRGTFNVGYVKLMTQRYFKDDSAFIDMTWAESVQTTQGDE